MAISGSATATSTIPPAAAPSRALCNSLNCPTVKRHARERRITAAPSTLRQDMVAETNHLSGHCLIHSATQCRALCCPIPFRMSSRVPPRTTIRRSLSSSQRIGIHHQHATTEPDVALCRY